MHIPITNMRFPVFLRLAVHVWPYDQNAPLSAREDEYCEKYYLFMIKICLRVFDALHNGKPNKGIGEIFFCDS